MKDKNLFSKLLISLFTFVISFMGIANVNAASQQKTTNAPKTIKAISVKKTMPGYISGYHFGMKRYTNGYIFCSDSIKKDSTKNDTLTLVGAKDAGYTYIIKNGPKMTNNADYNYYITQSAIWWYMDDTSNSSTKNLGTNFKSTGSDNYKLRAYVQKLVANAKKAKYPTPSIEAKTSSTTMSLSGNYYISKPISVVSKNNTANYSVVVPKGVQVINSKGETQTKFNKSESFRIKVPASKVNKSTSIKVKVMATGAIEKAYEYKPSKSSYQKVIPDQLYTEYVKYVEDTVTLKINYEKTTVNIIKKDKETDKALAGAKLKLSKDGKEIATWTSTTSAKSFTDLEAGTYTLEEVAAPAGYILNTNKVSFVIKAGDKTKEVVMYNTKKTEEKKHRLEITKKDADTKQILVGATLELSKDGKVIDTWISDDKPHVLTDVAEGTYSLREIAAPAGYLLDTTPITITITANDEVKAIVMYNHKKGETKHALEIYKKDKETDKTLAGAKLRLVDADGKVVATWTSTTDAYKIENLQPGTYTLEEIEAPNGYVLTSEKVTFTIGENDTLKVVTLYNLKETPVPITDSNVSILTMGIGATAILIGAYVLYKNKKKLA